MSKLTIIFIVMICVYLAHGQVITGCLRYFKNAYNQQRCIQCIFGMGLTQNNTCEFCRMGYSVIGGVCRRSINNTPNISIPMVNNNIQQTTQNSPPPSQNITRPQQTQQLPQQITTTGQSYQPPLINLPSSNNINRTNNQPQSSNTQSKTDSIPWSNWGNTEMRSFQSFPIFNNTLKPQTLPRQQPSTINSILNIPINDFMPTQDLQKNNDNVRPPLSQKIVQIPSVISTRDNIATVASSNPQSVPQPLQPIPTNIPSNPFPSSTSQPQPSNPQAQRQQQPVIQQQKEIVHKFPQYPFCFDYVDDSCWACVPGYVLNLIVNKCVPHVKAPNIAFKQKAQQTPTSQTPAQNCNIYSKQKQICEQCFRNYYFNTQKKQCLVVNPLCRTYNKNNGKCQTCYNTYKLNEGNCTKS